MKAQTILLNNWKAKVATLIIAIAVWKLIKQHVEKQSVPDFNPFPVPGNEQPKVPIAKAKPKGPALPHSVLQPVADHWVIQYSAGGFDWTAEVFGPKAAPGLLLA